MIALGISKKQEYYNRQRRHWRVADAVLHNRQVEKFIILWYY